MPHIVLLGDSNLDNGAYVGGGPDVNTQLRRFLPDGWKSTLLAVDGSTSTDVQEQLADLPPDVTHLVLSVGGNDALLRADVLEARVGSSAEALLLLGDAIEHFEHTYRTTVEALVGLGFPIIICTIYNANFSDPTYWKCVRLAIALYDDVIIRIGIENNPTVIDLRTICAAPEDYANEIERSELGGAKIARAIVNAVTRSFPISGAARVLGGPSNC
jgi:GDSL-like Lipase/Acylhydrolase family